MKIGVHLGLGAGYEEALQHAEDLGCTTVQIFTHSPRTFAFKALDEPRQKVLVDGWKRLGVHPVVSHASYLINIGAADNGKFHGALGILKNELIYGKAFGCQYVVFHVGKHLDSNPADGIAQVARGLNKLHGTLHETGVMLLLETAAGQGTEIGAKLEELHAVLEAVEPSAREHIGVCLDTCHLFAAGYDIRTMEGTERVISEIKGTFGLERVKVVHVNDSKFGCGERRDRHEHIGQGQIGMEGLKRFLNHPAIRDLPKILETPIDERGDQSTDMAALREVLGCK